MLYYICAPNQFDQAVDKDMSEGISALPADTWLEVIPQVGHSDFATSIYSSLIN
jgi:hypothetical protein